MKIVTAAELQRNLSHYLADVAERGERILVAGGDEGAGRDVMLVPHDETEYLLSNPANREALLESLEQAKRGEFISVELDDLLAGEDPA